MSGHRPFFDDFSVIGYFLGFSWVSVSLISIFLVSLRRHFFLVSQVTEFRFPATDKGSV